MKVVALFKLKPERSVGEYRTLSLEMIRAGMEAMPSVVGFEDFVVSGMMGGGSSRWDLAEIVEITSPAEFERDNRELPGSDVADTWNEWVAESEVIYLTDLSDPLE